MKFPHLPGARKGFGLLEVILVFAIVIGAAAAVFTVFQSAKPAADAAADRTMVQTVAANAFAMFPPHWDASSGAPVMMAFIMHPESFGPGGMCKSIRGVGTGCVSALTGLPVSLMETDVVSGSSQIGAAIGLRFTDITSDQCKALLAGGTASMGARGVESDSIATILPLADEAAVVNFCQSSADDGIINDVYVMFTPNSSLAPGV